MEWILVIIVISWTGVEIETIDGMDRRSCKVAEDTLQAKHDAHGKDGTSALFGTTPAGFMVAECVRRNERE